jgi:hypothetical protein
MSPALDTFGWKILVRKIPDEKKHDPYRIRVVDMGKWHGNWNRKDLDFVPLGGAWGKSAPNDNRQRKIPPSNGVPTFGKETIKIKNLFC